MNHGLPETMKVLVRGWLNCNQILLADGDEHYLIDTGYHSHSQQTLRLLETHTRRVSRIINTHSHGDHIGGNAALAARYGCPITVSSLEAPSLDPWDDEAFWLNYADQHAPPFRFTDTLSPGEVFSAGDTEWQVLAAPGHAMGALIFYSQKWRTLITGDALWQHGLGAVMPREGDNSELAAALDTLNVIEGLDVATVIPGHGEPFHDVQTAIGEARSRLQAFQADTGKNARNFMKVMFVFALLARGSMRYEVALEYILGVPVYEDLNRRFVHAPRNQLATMLLDELQRSGAITVSDEMITPQMAA
jgi:glyoxylase-like metal-dependent hydrolase (beta-lactamase superfamily II)